MSDRLLEDEIESSISSIVARGQRRRVELKLARPVAFSWHVCFEKLDYNLFHGSSAQHESDAHGSISESGHQPPRSRGSRLASNNSDAASRRLSESKHKLFENKSILLKNKSKIIENKSKIIENMSKVLENKSRLKQSLADPRVHSSALKSSTNSARPLRRKGSGSLAQSRQPFEVGRNPASPDLEAPKTAPFEQL